MTTRIFLVRHGETDANVSRVIQGQSGAATLTERGRVDVRLVANFLRSQLVSAPHVWTSDLHRSSESAHQICELLNLPAPELSVELRQRGWGKSEGRSYDERAGESAYTGAPGCELPEDAESVAQVMARLRTFFDRLCGTSRSEHVIVSHNELLNYLLDHFLGGTLKKRHLVSGEVVKVELDHNGRLLDRPRSQFPRRLVFVPDVKSFFRVEEAITLLRDHDLEVVSTVDSVDAHNVVGMILGDSHFGVEEARSFPRLRVVSRFGTGVDNVDVSGLWSQCHVAVTRTPQVNSASVAEFSVAALVLLLRNGLSHVSGLRENHWRRGGRGLELSEATVGVIGCGSIGMEVVRRLLRCGAKAVVWNRTWPPRNAGAEELALMVRASTIQELVQASDAITVHVAYATGTHHLLDHTVFDVIRHTNRRPVLANTSRGDVIDERALLAALNEGLVKSAAIDVWSAEGGESNDVVSALRGHPNVLPTPHIAGYTAGVMVRAAMECARSVVAIVEGRRTETADTIVAV